METVRQSLLTADASPLERLLAGRVALCWMLSTVADRNAAAASGSSLTSAEFWARNAERYNRRFLAAARSLALIRRLELPIVIHQTTIERTDQVVIGSEQPAPAPLGLESGGGA
jgi:hypothetical protein